MVLIPGKVVSIICPWVKVIVILRPLVKLNHKSNLRDQGLFIEMVIFRCCSFSSFLRPSTTWCPRLQAHNSKLLKSQQRNITISMNEPWSRKEAILPWTGSWKQRTHSLIRTTVLPKIWIDCIVHIRLLHDTILRMWVSASELLKVNML